MGNLPPAGGWVKLEVPAALVGLEGVTVSRAAFSQYDGRVCWDAPGKSSSGGTLIPWFEDAAPSGGTPFASGHSWDWVSGVDADFGYTGHLYHSASQLHLAWYRLFDTNLGRWLNRDLILEAAGNNLYPYVLSQPLSKVDRYGLEDYVVGGELDLVAGVGGEGSLAIVYDRDAPWESGMNLAIGKGMGLSIGAGWFGGIFCEVEGPSENLDANFGALGASLNFGPGYSSINGAAITFGPGGGAAVSQMGSWSLTLGDLHWAVRGWHP